MSRFDVVAFAEVSIPPEVIVSPDGQLLWGHTYASVDSWDEAKAKVDDVLAAREGRALPRLAIYDSQERRLFAAEWVERPL